MESIKKIEQELNWVRFTRNNIAMMLENVADVNVLIGGSYALKYQCDCFSEREVTDYDFIIRVKSDDVEKVHNLFHAMERMHIVEHGYSGNCAYKFNNVEYLGKHAECIIVPCDDTDNIHSFRVFGRIWEKPANIIKAKEEYIAEYEKKGRKPRQKDIDDVQNYYAHEDLPF